MSVFNKKDYQGFFNAIYKAISNKEKLNKTSVEKLAYTFKIEDKNAIKEITETAIVTIARSIASQKTSIKNRFDQIVDLYNSQVNLSHRTSQSMLLQQYSTPATIGFLLGIYVGVDKDGSFYEPSAGNGMLTIASNGSNFEVNEIDDTRHYNLKFQNIYKKITQLDSSILSTVKLKSYDGIITNPPFAALKDREEWLEVDGFKIKHLDHKMAILALNKMRDNGRAAIIVGGHTTWDAKGRVQAGKNRIFLSYLYKHYNVDDVINVDGHALYSKMGTAFNVRIILINGRKKDPSGYAPLKKYTNSDTVDSTDQLYNRISQYFETNTTDMKKLAKAKMKLAKAKLELEGMAMPYIPASESCFSLEVDTPDSMGFEIHAAIKRIKDAVGGSLNDYLVEKLKYNSSTELCKALAAEQIDGVATAIYNIETKDQGIIIGDQTGIGKGRQAASIVRYARENGMLPIFLTEKPNLFSDLYRDLEDIGNDHYKPFIVNARASKTNIKNNAGKIIAKAPAKSEQDKAFKKGVVPSGYDFVVSTYSQFASSKPTIKQSFLSKIAKGAIIIMDESHNASGSSATGEFLKEVVKKSKGTIFLSATFAKRPDNMPIYALKTSIQDANMDDESLVSAIQNGGVALQEILAAQLVQEGQMIRRERTYEGIEINYVTLDDLAVKHGKIADSVTDIIREMINFQSEYVNDMVDLLDDIAAAENKEVELTKGTKNAGVDNTPYFSRVFNVINQLLFSIKADEVANRAIMRLEQGMKPVIAFSNTMGAFVEEIDVDSVINADFKEVLKRGLDSVLSYTTTDDKGNKVKEIFSPDELDIEARDKYYYILDKIERVSTGIVISPIDHIVQKIQKAGYTTAEVTGRKKEVNLSYNADGTIAGEIQKRKKENANDAFRKFNNNEADVLLINQSGSTGASAHAVPTKKVPEDEVKQRVMIVLQAELNINTEVQKRGRINRTGQIMKPIYDYVASAIPAEKRLQMMLQKKMKSLDANTTSNQKNSEDLMKSEDFLNKYGDDIVKTWLLENPKMNEILGNLVTEDTKDFTNIAHKASGRVAILPIKQQEAFYKTILDQYHTEVERLLQRGEYDLEVEDMDLKAVTKSRNVVVIGKNNNSLFGGNTYLEKCEVNNLRKPYSKDEVIEMLAASGGNNAQAVQDKMLERFDAYVDAEMASIYVEKTKKWDRVKKNITKEKKYKDAADQQAFYNQRVDQIELALQKDIEDTQTKFKNKTDNTRRFIKFFKIGRGVKYPMVTYGDGATLSDAIVLDVTFNENAENPYTPSNITFSIAVSNSEKRLDYKASGKFQQELNAIIGQSHYLSEYKSREMLENWDATIRESTSNRVIRYIVTGNILQGYAAYEKGKLVSYTTNDGGVNKGILMPLNWQPSGSNSYGSSSDSSYVTVGIHKVADYVRGTTNGGTVRTNTALSFQKRWDGMKMFVPASRKKGGHIYLDKEVLKLTEKNNFDKISSQMVATIPMENLDKLLKRLQDEHSVSALIPQSRANDIPAIQNAIKAAEKLEKPKENKNLKLAQAKMKMAKAKLLLMSI